MLNKHNGNKTHQIPIRVGWIITPCKETRSQSRWERNLVLNKDHEVTEYIEAVRDRRQTQVLTKYRPSDPKVTPEQRWSGSRAHWSGYTSLKRCQIMHSYRRTCKLLYVTGPALYLNVSYSVIWSWAEAGRSKLGQRVTKLRSVCPSWITKYNFSHLANVHTQIIQEQGVCDSEQLSPSNPYTKCQHLCNTDTLGLLNFNVQVKLKNSFKLHAAVLKNRKPLFIVILTYFSYTWPFALFYVGFNLVT